MYKIALSGKAGVGKDTFAKLLCDLYKDIGKTKIEALSNPIKEIAMSIFPYIEKSILYGPSQCRNQIIPKAFKDGEQLTYRVLLQDIGTICRGYNKEVWIDNLKFKAEKAEKENVKLFIVTDVRLKNEFDFFKQNHYSLIRIKRATKNFMTHESELEQDGIDDKEFSYIIDNNKDISNLREKATEIIYEIESE